MSARDITQSLIRDYIDQSDQRVEPIKSLYLEWAYGAYMMWSTLVHNPIDAKRLRALARIPDVIGR